MSHRRIAILAASIALAASAAQAQTPAGAPIAVFGPNYYVGVGAVFVSRAKTGGNPLLVADETGVGVRAPLLNYRDVSTAAFAPGFEIFGGMRLDDHWWLKAEFLWLSQTRRTQSGFGPPANVGFPFGEDSATTGFDDAESFAATLRQNMLTARIGAWYRFRPWLSVIGGLRYMHIADRLDVSTFGAGADDDHVGNTHTRNHLFGGELGLALHHEVVRGLTVRLQGTAGAFANFSGVKRFYFDNENTLTFRDDVRRTAFSFVSEGRVSFEYRFHEMIAAFVGYRVIYVSGVATGAANGGTTIAASGAPAALHTLSRNGALYHGGFAGLKVTW